MTGPGSADASRMRIAGIVLLADRGRGRRGRSARARWRGALEPHGRAREPDRRTAPRRERRPRSRRSRRPEPGRSAAGTGHARWSWPPGGPVPGGPGAPGVPAPGTPGAPGSGPAVGAPIVPGGGPVAPAAAGGPVAGAPGGGGGGGGRRLGRRLRWWRRCRLGGRGPRAQQLDDPGPRRPRRGQTARRRAGTSSRSATTPRASIPVSTVYYRPGTGEQGAADAIAARVRPALGAPLRRHPERLARRHRHRHQQLGLEAS